MKQQQIVLNIKLYNCIAVYMFFPWEVKPETAITSWKK